MYIHTLYHGYIHDTSDHKMYKITTDKMVVLSLFTLHTPSPITQSHTQQTQKIKKITTKTTQMHMYIPCIFTDSQSTKYKQKK